MGTIIAQDYKSPAIESGKGNLNVDVIEFTYAGDEPNGTVVKLRRMSEYNTYVRITLIGNGGLTPASATVDLGYLSREDGVADDLQALAAGVDLQTALWTENISDAIGDVVKVPAKHDLALTLVNNNAGNAGNTVKVIAEFINVAG